MRTVTHPPSAPTGYDPPLDPGIAAAVIALCAAGVETFESCEGGSGHAYPEPTIRFYGGQPEGYRALAAAQQAGLPVRELRRVWIVLDDEPVGPWWELVLHTTVLRQLPPVAVEAGALTAEGLPAGP